MSSAFYPNSTLIEVVQTAHLPDLVLAQNTRRAMTSRAISESQTNERRGDIPARNDHRRCSMCLLIVLAIITAPYRRTFKLYTWRPLQEMRAAHGDRDILVPLIKQWKVEKTEELRSVQVSVCLDIPSTLTISDIGRPASALELHWQVCPGPKPPKPSGLQVRFSSAVSFVRYGLSLLQSRPSLSLTTCRQKKTSMQASQIRKCCVYNKPFCATNALLLFNIGLWFLSGSFPR